MKNRKPCFLKLNFKYVAISMLYFIMRETSEEIFVKKKNTQRFSVIKQQNILFSLEHLLVLLQKI